MKAPQPEAALGAGLARSMKTSTLPDVTSPLQAHHWAWGSGTQQDHLSLDTAGNCCANERGLNWRHGHTCRFKYRFVVLGPVSKQDGAILRTLKAKETGSHGGH